MSSNRGPLLGPLLKEIQVKQIRKRLTYANVMSSIAVFFVLGGATAFAATKIGTNEIKANAIVTGKIKKEAVTEGKIKAAAIGNTRLGNASVTAPKIAANAVTNPAIANGSVNSAKLAPAAVTSAQLAPGAVTAAQLGPGAIGAAQRGTLTLRTESAPVAVQASGSAHGVCAPGERVISGGGAWTAFGEDLSFLSTRPIKSLADTNAMATGETPTGWRSSGFNGSAAANSIQAYVICLG